ncbi:MAG: cyclase family protein [Culicoidibacterales bacterium]
MKYIDLTHAWDQLLSIFPGDPSFSQKQEATVQQDGYQLTKYELHSHLGTHIDTPKHLLENGKTTQDYPLEQFIGQTYVVAMPSSGRENEWIKQHQFAIERAEIVLFVTHWSNLFGSEQYFQDFPTLPIKVVRWLATQKLKMIGIDAPSFDQIESHLLPNHHCLLEVDILLIENLTNLAMLPTWCEVSAYPLPVASDGSPVRAVARYELKVEGGK